jgi:YVTN family beta-propeller protein
VGVGVATALMLISGGDNTGGAALPPTRTSSPGQPSPTATPARAPELRVGRSVRVGRRPNVAVAAGDAIFVGSYREPRLAIVSASTVKRSGFTARVGFGLTDAAVGFGLVWLSVARSGEVVALDPRSGKIRHRFRVGGRPGSIATGGGAVWVGLVNGGDIPDVLLKLNPRTGAKRSTTPYPWGINALAPGPNALWIVARRRARVVRASLRTGKPGPNVQVGHSPSTDAAFGDGGLWVATREEDTVSKIITATGDKVPISVGKYPQQLTYANGHVYVANFNSSDLTVIDTKTTRVVGDAVDVPVNPFALAVAGGALWVTSPPNNVLTRVVIARGA